MFTALIILLLGMCLYSLYSAFQSWQAVRRGRVHIDIVRDLTGMVDRRQINAVFGEPEPGLIYNASPRAIWQARAPASWLLSNEALDILISLALVYALLVASQVFQLVIVLIAGAYVLSGYAVAVYMILSHIDQIEEEI